MIRTPALKEMVEKLSIPHKMRREMWQVFAGSLSKMVVNPGYYQSMLNKQAIDPSPATEEIEKDLHRSLDHPFFKNDEGFL